jgi:vitamin B12 transporter
LNNYWLVDIALHFRITDSVTLFARGANLLDEDYEEVYGYRTPGRTGYIGVRTNFGVGGN